MRKVTKVSTKALAKQANAKGGRDTLHHTKYLLTKHPHTKNIKFLGVGVSEDDERFLKVEVGQETALLNVDNIADLRSGELKILTRLGAPLIKPQARTEFVSRAQDAACEEPTFKVVTKTGWRDGKFVLPLGLAPEGEADIERYFEGDFARYHGRLRREGSFEGWQELALECKEKSRLIATLCLQFTGPVCGALGYEPPGLQLVYRGGFGMTTIGRVGATVWGGDPDPGRKIGCGVSWNNTTNKLEVVAAAFNQLLLYLDDMHNAGEGEIKAIFNIMNGEGRGRLRERQQKFSLSVFSTSNTSIVKIAKRLKLEDELEALIDRLPEISLPEGWPYFFEGIRTPDEFRAYGNRIRNLACRNFGWAGPDFVHRFEGHLKVRRTTVEAFAKKCQDAYFLASKAVTSAGGRDVTRVGNKFATIYVSGCLASHFKILPFSKPEILEALLACRRDHVAFIDRELGYAAMPTRVVASAHEPAIAHVPTAGVPAPAERLFRRLRRFVNDSRKVGFHDFRKPAPATAKPPGRTNEPVLGYIGEHEGQTEYRIFGPTFKQVAGGAAEDRILKQELFKRGLLVTDRRGERVSFVVKRFVPGKGRVYVVALRQKADKR